MDRQGYAHHRVFIGKHRDIGSLFRAPAGSSFNAVVPKGTAREKIAQIEFYGGEIKKVEPGEIYGEAARLARRLGGHYADQFTYAEWATDWRGNNNIAESIFLQMAKERYPKPSHIVVGAGTGRTSSTIGRYIRYRPDLSGTTRLCVVDPENSVFLEYFRSGDASLTAARGSRIEGIGRPRVEPSFLSSVIDQMIGIPDAASIATVWWLEKVLGRKCGASTGTNLFGALRIAGDMLENDQSGSIVTMICDPGERYLGTYFDSGWLETEGLDIVPYVDSLKNFAATGRWRDDRLPPGPGLVIP